MVETAKPKAREFLRSVWGFHSRSAHLNIARHPFIDSRPRFPLVFKALRLMVVGNYPGKEVPSRNSLMLWSQV